MLTNLKSQFGKKESSPVSKVSPISSIVSTTSKASKEFSPIRRVNHIYDVPAGLVASALQYLDPKERIKLRQLSQKFNAIVSDSRCWTTLNCGAIFTTLDPEIFVGLCERAGEQLTHINLKSCWQILDDELGVMTNLCPNLQAVCLSNCWKITDRGVSYLAYGLTKLRFLDLSYCGQLKGFGFIDHKWGNLRSLNITHCKQIGDEQLEKILSMAPEIETIKMRRCVRLTDFGVFLIIRHCRYVEFCCNGFHHRNQHLLQSGESSTST
ncbi:hypothetical protein BC830DRAFT_81263 [Chytriomyces sp. MP71]|nr:hypothetical protein BC830DRAFT_81263 [Chytriomyces sp. MP71]